MTGAQIAAAEGISRPRVTQIMALLDLPQEIQQHLAKLTEPREIQFFSERRLRQMGTLDADPLRLQAWSEMLKEFRGKSAI